MAYDPKTGKFELEDSGVAKRVTNLMAQNNPLMQQARARGAQASNRRGLMNSSIGVQAGETAAYDVVMPIASQEAGQVHQANLQGRDLELQDIASKRDAGTRQQIASMQVNAQQSMQRNSLAAEKEAREANFGFQREMADLDMKMRQLDRDAQERIQSLQLSSSERSAASSMAVGFEQTYSQVVSNIMNNPEIPAAERQRYMDNAARTRDSNLALVEQMYNINLSWA